MNPKVKKLSELDPRLKYKLYTTWNQNVLQFKAHQDIFTHPKVHYNVNTHLIEMRNELYDLGRIKLKERRERLFRKYLENFRQEESELRAVDLAYFNTQI